MLKVGKKTVKIELWITDPSPGKYSDEGAQEIHDAIGEFFIGVVDKSLDPDEGGRSIRSLRARFDDHK